MTLGDGIFWGGLVASVVALYLGTKDRWRWKKIVLWGVGGLLGLGLLVGGGVFSYTKWEERPQMITEYWGIKLGATTDDVVFLKGQPTKRDEAEWNYTTDSLGVRVEFDKRKVVSVLAFATDRLHLPKVGNISAYVTMEELKHRFGEPSHVSISVDGEDRILNYAQYNLVTGFNRNGMNFAGMSARGKPVQFRYVKEESGSSTPASGAATASGK